VETALAQVLLDLTLLAYHSYEMIHAIALTLIRMTITQRKLLEWETAASAAARATKLTQSGGLRAFTDGMWTGPAVALGLLLLTVAGRLQALPTALPFIVLWLSSPFVAYLLSRPAVPRAVVLEPKDRAYLRRVAARTWRYFETYANETEHWLPPDNVQEHLDRGIAHRTSPTDIGMGMLATLSAHDLGFVDAPAMMERLERTMATIEGLEGHEGHLFNWYDTKLLAPLSPRYVSTVDSANLAGALVAIAQGLRHLRPLHPASALREAAVEDTLQLFGDSLETLARVRPDPKQVDRVTQALRDMKSQESTPGSTDASAVEKALVDLDLDPSEGPEPAEAAFWGQALLRLLRGEISSEPAPEWDQRCAALAQRMEQFAYGMDFRFLYDRVRRILSIGYPARRRRWSRPPRRLLLRSPRFGSALGELLRHRQGRRSPGALVPARARAGGRARRAVSRVVERLDVRVPDAAARHAQLSRHPAPALLRRRRESPDRYGRRHGVPWGISESAFGVVDRHGVYQYKAFGVPEMGLKRGLAEDLVIAPYATALAAMVQPSEAAANLRRLAREGAEAGSGSMRPWTTRRARTWMARSRPPADARCRSARYFAHHQGMAIVALANALLGDRTVSCFHADPRVQATSLLLQERVPRFVPITRPRPIEVTQVAPSIPPTMPRRFRTPHTLYPHAAFLSNGRYVSVITNAGGGSSSCRGLSVTRQREDAVCDPGSVFLYLRDVRSGAVWSPTYLPTRHQPTSTVPPSSPTRR
jgi:cyclic beta-1,2-glucan synthetase